MTRPKLAPVPTKPAQKQEASWRNKAWRYIPTWEDSPELFRQRTNERKERAKEGV